MGAGPAGLTAAGDLADRGYAVTVFEERGAAGGMLRWGIPEYRLPNDILDYEVDLIRRKGVDIVLNCSIGKDRTFDDIRREHECVFIGAGAHTSRELGIEGEHLPGVDYGVEFLRKVGEGARDSLVKDSVVVIGGGNVAIDVARTALRLGAKKVELVALEQRDEMPAYDDEIKATLEEGIEIRNGRGPHRIVGGCAP